MQRNVAARITGAIDRFAETETGDVRRIRGRPGITRLRVGDYRVFFRSDRNAGTLDVISVPVVS